MHSFVRIVGATVVALSVACAALDVTTGPGVPMVRFRAEPYSFTFFSGLDQPARVVVRDASAWQAIWSEIHEGRSSVPAVPAIDFSQEMIVVAALGSRGSSGYGILLESAAETGTGGIAITVRSTSPGSNCGVLTVITQPVDIARLGRRDGVVGFVELSQTVNCN